MTEDEKDAENQVDSLEQYVISDYLGCTINKEEEVVAEVIADVFYDDPIPNPVGDPSSPMTFPDNVKKGRALFMDDIIHQTGERTEPNVLITEKEENSERTNTPVRSKISVYFPTDEGKNVSLSNKLTIFDREVIDAVSTLAETSNIMTAASIYRMITGKSENVKVVALQLKKVEESMRRCGNCEVVIDFTSKLEGALGGIKEGESLQYSEKAITFQSISHTDGTRTTTYYKIITMPPFYKYATRLGKISVIPLNLIDTPVAKRDAVIAVQSSLIRVIDVEKKRNSESMLLNWDDLFQEALLGGKKDGRDEKHRTKGTIIKILEYWKEQQYIINFEAPARSKTFKILL